MAPAAGCHGKGSDAARDAGAREDPAEVARATELAGGAEPLPPREEVRALAQAIERRAVREGAGGRATELHALAARVVERAWRIDGVAEDATLAMDDWRAAARDLGVPGACEASVRQAALAGDAAHDASVAYAELYRAARAAAALQAKGGPAAAECVARIGGALAMVEPFRPPARVLEAIDEGLAREGAVAAGGVDAQPVRPFAPPRIVRVEEWPGEESARVVVVLDRAARFRAGDEASAAGTAPRTFVELDGVDVGTVARDVPLGGVVTRVRSEATTTGARVVLELSGRAYRRVFHLLEPYRIVIDIARHPPGEARGRGARSVTRVAIDPGHGGSDPGAIGPGGVREKDVTLDIAHKVAPVLARQGVQVLLTRDDDRHVPLDERTARANAYGADLFISVHCNAAPDRAHRGVETYVLDTSKDEMAGRIAARENATSQAATAELGGILASMRIADQSTRSAKLAELLQRAALASLSSTYPDVVDGGLHTAGFYVLVGARMPAILFETSYLSNAIDEERLGGDDYKERLADGIVNAVKAYREGR